MLGQLQDAGNAATLVHYLDLLGGAGLVAGLQKFAGAVAQERVKTARSNVTVD